MPKLFDTAAQAVDWIVGLRYKGEKSGLSNIRALLERLGSPQERLRFVHVAGTNGKGSTCAMIERMLRECGLKTGLFTSPHLIRYNERIRVNGREIDDKTLIELTSRVRVEAEKLAENGIYPTFFELGTAIAMLYFELQQVDIAVIEVGLGGRLDATNVITPEVSVIVPIGKDHTHVLGDTLPAIAGEKAGIIKPGIPVVVQDQPEEIRGVFHRVAHEQNSPLTDLHDHSLRILEEQYDHSVFELDGQKAEVRLCGRHQVQNAALALSAVKVLRSRGYDLPQEKLLSGLRKAVWPGRLEWLDRQLLIDGAHNPHGANSLLAYVQTFLKDRRIVLLVGMMKDKDVSSCAGIYAQIAHQAVCTQIDYPRAMPCEEVAALCREKGMTACAEKNISQAISLAREQAGEDGVVILCGSLYLVGDVRLLMHREEDCL